MQKTYITVVSLNAWYGTLLDEVIAHIASIMDEVDVFCFQEANGAIDPALDSALLDQFEGHYSTKQTESDYFRLATYVRRGIPVIKTEDLLTAAPGTGAAFSCTLQLETGVRLTVTNVHGQSQPGHKKDTPARLQQTKEIIEYTAEQTGVNIVIGDFNLQPDTISITQFADNGYQNLIEEFNIPTTRNEEAWRLHPGNKQLFADYAFVQGDQLIDYSLTVDDITISDHLPLTANLTISSIQPQREAVTLTTAESISLV